MLDTVNATSSWRQADPQLSQRLMKGAIDLHCHSGPSVMPRYCDHHEAMHEASEAGMRALLIKDHYYSATPVTEMLNKHLKHLNVQLLSGVPLNNQAGGLNIYAVEHGIALGAKLIWMPTFSSANHIAHHKADANFKFPKSEKRMMASTPLSVLDANGKLLPEVGPILDMIAENDVVLSSGHLHISEIYPLFEEAKKRGVKRLLTNHPTYIVDANLDDIRRLVAMNVYIEHSMCMFAENSKFKFYDPETLKGLIEAGTVDRTILGSDLGQAGNPNIAEGFRNVIEICLDLGYSEADVRKMTSTNAAQLMGLDK
jgi:formylmethanofuran dehydrogenase subunit D